MNLAKSHDCYNFWLFHNSSFHNQTHSALVLTLYAQNRLYTLDFIWMFGRLFTHISRYNQTRLWMVKCWIRNERLRLVRLWYVVPNRHIFFILPVWVVFFSFHFFLLLLLLLYSCIMCLFIAKRRNAFEIADIFNYVNNESWINADFNV